MEATVEEDTLTEKGGEDAISTQVAAPASNGGKCVESKAELFPYVESELTFIPQHSTRLVQVCFFGSSDYCLLS